jgi:hypothetical protein
MLSQLSFQVGGSSFRRAPPAPSVERNASRNGLPGSTYSQFDSFAAGGSPPNWTSRLPQRAPSRPARLGGRPLEHVPVRLPEAAQRDVRLRHLYVLVFLSIGSRRIEYLACTSNPNTAWMLQQARNLLMELDDCQHPRASARNGSAVPAARCATCSCGARHRRSSATPAA